MQAQITNTVSQIQSQKTDAIETQADAAKKDSDTKTNNNDEHTEDADTPEQQTEKKDSGLNENVESANSKDDKVQSKNDISTVQNTADKKKGMVDTVVDSHTQHYEKLKHTVVSRF